ncbi:MAG TPA: TonB-dependent siderophore receptor [Pseudomonas sabulinigri]|uniref:TonB-dependent receptor plug domain-containing protein n=1 Tax=marine sediment metagenome TaxID=412755 RepID=A0A0F9S6E4_9ZZZZ|nr:TonB-dependent siderophore receptor [Halopseudomonas sabulinigri]HEC52205.1 TonB-dependent siderophore receptor [Halopseudomonas sabulinigri]
MKEFFLRSTGALLLCAPASYSLAQDTLELPALEVIGTRQTAAGLQLDVPVEAGSRLGITPRETPASVSVVNREQITARGAENTQDILASIPGVTAAAPPGSAGFISWRGFTGSQVTQMFNGIALQYDAIAARPVDSWIYDRVEAIGGASSFLNGSGGVGGSVNYISKLADPNQSFVEGRIKYGSYDSRELAFGLNQQLNEGPVRNTLRLDVSQTESNGYVDREERSAFTSALSLRTDFTPQLSHTLALEYQNEQVDSPYWGTPVLQPIGGEMKIDESRRFENYNVEDGRYEQRVRWLRSITEYWVSDHTRLRNTFYHYNTERNYRNLERYTYTADNSQISRSGAYQQRHDQEVNGDRVELLHNSRLFDRKSDWSLGLDFSHNVQTRYPRSISGEFDKVDPDNFDPGHFYDIPGMTPGHEPQRSNELNTWALYLENRTELTDRLALLTGLRHDWIDLQVTNHQTSSASNPAKFGQTYEPTTGRIGLVYDLTPAANVYVQYSTAADPPAGVLTTASFGQVQDIDLTTGEQWEVGSKFDFLDGRGSATVALYQITRTDLATNDPNNPGETLPVGQQSSTGIEVAGSLWVTPKLLAEGNFAWVDAEYDEFNDSVGGASVSRAGNTPSNVPDKVANLWLTYDVAPRWQLGVDTRYVGSVYADAANTLSVPSYTLFGAFVGYELAEDTQLSLRGRNLSDEVYARNAGSTMLYLGAPRTFEVALQTRF